MSYSFKQNTVTWVLSRASKMRYIHSLTLALLVLTCCSSCLSDPVSKPHQACIADTVSNHAVKNLIAYSEDGKFCGWPANEGIWKWDNEILAAFEISSFIKNNNGHSIDRNSPKFIYFVRSTDGGETWVLEKHPEVREPVYLEDPNMQIAARSYFKNLGEKIDFTHPGFAMKLRANNFYFSYDKGKNWQWPFGLPSLGQKLVMARTDYTVLGKNDCIAFITVSNLDGNYGKNCAIRTTDGGLTWNQVGWMTNEFPPAKYKKFSFSIMPQTIMLSENKLVSALRQRFEGDCWIDIYGSDDLGKSWKFISKAAGGVNNPPSLVKLDDGRLCLVYCYRQKPFGLRAKLSSDNGRTWSDEIILRGDALSWDIGYVRSVQRPDGNVVSLYYYHTAQNPQQHIAASIWKP
jgi:hypothetical protein